MATAQKTSLACAVLALFAGLAGPVMAQETDQGAYVSIELNAVEPMEGACRVSFLVQNGHAFDIDHAVYEVVLFDTEGGVERLTLFDFADLPASRPRVRQFVIPELACDGLGRILINGAETCAGEGVASNACIKDLDLTSRIDVEMMG